MEHYELIRRKVLIDGKSQREVAKELSHSRKTVAKALELRIPPGYRLSGPRPRPVIEPVRHIIDAWLEQNKHTRPKQCQTGQRIYERQRKKRAYHKRKEQQPEPVEDKRPKCKGCGGPREAGHTYCEKCAERRTTETRRQAQSRYWRKQQKHQGSD